MGQIIQLTAITRNGKTIAGGPVLTGFDIDDIVSPITANISAGYSKFTTRGKKAFPANDQGGVDQVIWTVSETLATIASYSQILLNLTVIRRRSNKFGSGINYVFNSKRIQEALVTTTTPGVKFMYSEDGDPLPVEYEVSNSLASIVSASSTVFTLTARNGATIQGGSFIEWGQTIAQAGDPGALIHNTEVPMAGNYFALVHQAGGGGGRYNLFKVNDSNPHGAGIIETIPTFNYMYAGTDSTNAYVGVNPAGELYNTGIKPIYTSDLTAITGGAGHLSGIAELVNKLAIVIGGNTYYIPCSAANTPLV